MPINRNICLWFILLYVFVIQAQSDKQAYIDMVENFGDTVQKVKKEKNKFLPVALPITEPAVGYGLAAGLLYFFEKKDSSQVADMAAGVGGFTSNGTWFAGGGYLGYWKNDHIRYSGFAGYGHINLDYYGFGGEPIAFSQNAAFLMQQLKFRLGNGGFFAGGKIQISKITIPIEGENFDPEDMEIWNNGVGGLIEYDKLNNTLSPTQGFKFHVGYDQFMEFLGSQRDWGRLKLYAHWYFPINEIWEPALRFEFLTATGHPPFYAYPYVSLRGIPAMRYQANSVFVAETQQLFNLTDRWGVLGFTGLGTTISSVDKNIKNEVVWNAGGGVRFMAIRNLGLKVGADMARGPEEWAFYFSVGSAW